MSDEKPAATSAPSPEATPPDPAAAPPAAGSPPASGADSGAAAPVKAKAKDKAWVAQEALKLRRQRQAFGQELEQLRGGLGDTKKQLEELRVENERLRGIEARLKADPLSVAKELGANPEEGIRTFLKANTPEAEIENVKRQLEEERKARLEDQKRRQEQEAAMQAGYAARAEQARLQSFVQAVVSTPEKYKYLLAEYEPQDILAQATSVHNWAKQQKDSAGNPATYTFEEVASFLDQQAKIVHDRRSERRTKLLAPAQAESESAPANGQHRQTDTESAKGPKPKSGPKPPPRKLTRAEEEAEDLARLSAAFDKDRADIAKGAAKH